MRKSTSSQSKSLPSSRRQSTENYREYFSPDPQANLFADGSMALPGSMYDAALVRLALIEAIRKSDKSRETIADEMSSLSGTQVTVRRINAFTAESREDYRFPLELTRAFCVATSDFTLLRRVAEMAGFRLIDVVEADLLELGRESLRQKRASENIALLEKRLQGVDL